MPQGGWNYADLKDVKKCWNDIKPFIKPDHKLAFEYGCIKGADHAIDKQPFIQETISGDNQFLMDPSFEEALFYLKEVAKPNLML